MMAAVAEEVDPITEAQRACWTGFACTAEDFFSRARWWDLEASRGGPSAPRYRRYATTMLLAAERRLVTGEAEPWTPGEDQHAPECARCGGPSAGWLACGCAL